MVLCPGILLLGVPVTREDLAARGHHHRAMGDLQCQVQDWYKIYTEGKHICVLFRRL